MADDDVPTPIVVTVLGLIFAAGAYILLPGGARETVDIATEKPVVVESLIVQTAALPTGTPRQEKAEPDDDAVNGCRDRHPKDYNLRNVCERGEKQARFKAKTFQIDYDVGVLCAKKHPANWTYYVVCAREQMDAKLKPDQKPTRPNFSVEEMCALEFPEDFRMIRHCEQQQDEAQSQAGSWIPDNVARRCTSEWSADWRMFMYCAKNQVGAEGFTDPERHISSTVPRHNPSRSRRQALDEIINAPSPKRSVHTSSTGSEFYARKPLCQGHDCRGRAVFD